VQRSLNPNIIFRGQFPYGLAGILRPCRLNEQDFAFVLCKGFVFLSFFYNVHLTTIEPYVSISKIYTHRTFKHQENFIRISMGMPHEIALKFT
jgi:hypothetical protein